MYDISSLEEARALLAKEKLSDTEVRELLLYFLQRDDEARKAFGKIKSMCLAFLKIFRALLSRATPSENIEKQKEMQDALKALDDVYEALAPPGSIH